MDWFDGAPKAEIHVHLEGAIPLEALNELVRKYGGDPIAPDIEALQRMFEYRDFPHFLAHVIRQFGSQFLVSSTRRGR